MLDLLVICMVSSPATWGIVVVVVVVVIVFVLVMPLLLLVVDAVGTLPVLVALGALMELVVLSVVVVVISGVAVEVAGFIVEVPVLSAAVSRCSSNRCVFTISPALQETIVH